MADKGIRVECRQTLVNYRMPTSLLIKESFPLPPYSTVIGMVHAVCGFTSYHPMRVSVQGTAQATVSDLYTRYSFGNSKFEEGRHQCFVEKEDKRYGIYKGIAHAELIAGIDLVLHILPEPDDFQTVWNGLLHPQCYPALGRHEDLLDIESVSSFSLRLEEEAICNHDILAPLSCLDEFDEEKQGTVYRINKTFQIDKKSGLRYWDQVIEAKYICSGEGFRDVYVDEKNDVVFAV